jgi:hypothetical protein
MTKYKVLPRDELMSLELAAYRKNGPTKNDYKKIYQHHRAVLGLDGEMRSGHVCASTDNHGIYCIYVDDTEYDPYGEYCRYCYQPWIRQ